MTETSLAEVSAALQKREAFIRENIETLSVKKVTRLLEEDLGLPTKSLARFKEELGKRITKIVEQVDCDEEDGGQNGEEEKSENSNEASFEEEEEGGEEEEEEEVKRRPESKGKKRKPPAEKKPQTSKKKVRVSPPRDSKPKAAPIGGPVISKLKKILKDATIKISPNVYSQNRDVDSLAAALESLARKHGLGLNSTPHEISRVKGHLERTRDLEGIDTSNIVTGTGRRPRRAAAMVSYKSDDLTINQENPLKKTGLKRKQPNPSKNTSKPESSEDDPIEVEDDDIDGGETGNPGHKSTNGNAQARSKRRTLPESDSDEAESGGEQEKEEAADDKGGSDSEESGSDEEDTGEDEESDYEGEDGED
ncbi:hypothetical protein BSKO_07018 [Bryopsis sp. KO-2023]|nr:hypothetical protein BSKO_07018 [Bryopsis sp. KO-2023]